MNVNTAWWGKRPERTYLAQSDVTCKGSSLRHVNVYAVTNPERTDKEEYYYEVALNGTVLHVGGPLETLIGGLVAGERRAKEMR